MRLSYIGVAGILTAALVFVTSPLLAQVQYKVIPIYSPFNPSDYVIGSDISKGGVLPLTDVQNGQRQAFEWKAGKSLPLTLFGGQCSSANGINNAGHIVGGACPSGETLRHAYLYRKGSALDLGTFGGTSSVGIGVNRFDQVAGYYTLTDGTARAFLWQRKGWADLGSLGGSFIYAYDLDDSGTITGQSDISNDPDPVYGIPPFHGFQWSKGVLADLGPIFGGNFNYGNSINSAGVIVGSSDVAGDTGAHAFIWNQGTVTDLTPDGNIDAWGTDINTQGQVVGIWGSVDPNPADGPPVDTMACPCYAVLWQNGQATFLNDVVPPQWNLLGADAINDRGEILADAQLKDGSFQKVLLKPLKHAAPQATGGANPMVPSHRPLIDTAPRLIQRMQGGGFRLVR